MNKSELIDAIAAQTGLSKAATAQTLDAAVSVIQGAVAQGDSVTLVGFGTFSRKERQARTGRNPQTGKEIKIAASAAPAFKPGATFRDQVKAGKK